ERDAQQQLGNEQKRAEELTADLARQAEAQRTPPTEKPPAIVSTILIATGVRGVDETNPPTMVIPRGAQQVRLALDLKEHDYRSYQLILQPVGGSEILHRTQVQPTVSKAGARFTVMLPASRFASGDYIMTLKGVTPHGE